MEDFVLAKEKNNRSYSNGGKCTLEILTGEKALKQIGDVKFIAEWRQLYKDCPWATVYQTFDFVSNWYKIYHEKHQPILITSFEEGVLKGLLALCLGKPKQIHGAGLNQAEYQTWISTTADSDSFVQSAILGLQKQYPRHQLQLKFIPEQTPLKWVQTNPYWEKSAWLQPSKHPIMRIDKKSLGDQLRKKNKREKVNRLKRLGELKFERITDYSTFASIFDELAIQNDFRKGAVYNAHYFQENSLSKSFLLSLFRHNLLHATVLKVDQEIIASNVGTFGRKWVHLQGINTHSPSHAKHSPGILHFLMLGQMMADEGLEVFDLTPGSDPYKDTLATDYLECFTLSIKNPSSQRLSKLKSNFTNWLKSYLNRVGIKPYQQRNYKNSLSIAFEKMKIAKTHGAFSLLKSGVLDFKSLNPPRVYRIQSGEETERSSSLEIRKNSLKDLLDFQTGGSLLTRWEFLEAAMKRLEAGQQSYSLMKGSNLVCCVWKDKLPRTKKSSKQEIPTRDNPPSQLNNLYFHPLGEKLVKPFLQKVVEEINREEQKDCAYALLNTHDRRVSVKLEKMGFSQISSNLFHASKKD